MNIATRTMKNAGLQTGFMVNVSYFTSGLSIKLLDLRYIFTNDNNNFLLIDNDLKHLLLMPANGSRIHVSNPKKTKLLGRININDDESKVLLASLKKIEISPGKKIELLSFDFENLIFREFLKGIFVGLIWNQNNRDLSIVLNNQGEISITLLSGVMIRKETPAKKAKKKEKPKLKIIWNIKAQGWAFFAQPLTSNQVCSGSNNPPKLD